MAEKTPKPLPRKCPYCFGSGRVADQGKIASGMRNSLKKSGLTVKAVAAAMNITGGYLSDLLRARRLWTLPLQVKFEGAILEAKTRT